MPGPCSPPWAAPYHRRGAASPQLRVSDADREEVASQLSKHYGDGRLDQAEFDERLGRAMNAKTQADLSGLLADLPSAGPPDGAARPPRRRPFPRMLVLVLIIVIAAAAGHALTHLFLPWAWLLVLPWAWLLLAVLVLSWLRPGSWRRRRRAGPL